MKIKTITLISLFSIVITSCKIKYPSSEVECISEAKLITKYIQNSQYEKLNEYLEKYQKYQKLTTEGLTKDYKPLQEALDGIDIDHLKQLIKRDTITINYGRSTEYIINLYLTFFKVSKDKPDCELCQFTFSKEHDHKYYELSFWDHSIRKPRKIILPAGGVTPPAIHKE